ncbi:MAG: OmpA family protein [Oligoflexus sp.]
MAKKKKCPEFENHERWLVSYADMMTLLFAVFVVLYALKEDGAKDAKVEQAAASIKEAFNEVMEDIPVNRRVGPTQEGFGIFEHMHGDQIRPPITEKFPSSDRHFRIIDQELKQVQRQVELRLYGDKKFRELEAKGQQRIITVQRDDTGIRIQLLAAHFFPPASYQLNPKSHKELLEVAGIVKDLGRRVTIEGHTDATPMSGSMNNWDLSSLRATQVVRFFIERANFPPTSIGGAGFADTRPVASNATAESRALNRRIEIKVHYDE